MPAVKPFTIDEYVRWSDVDAAGIICYGAYVRFVEIAETELFRAIGMPYGQVFDRFNCWLPRAHFSCNFYVPAYLDERLTISAFVKRLGNKSVTLAFEIHNASGAKVADFEVVLVAVDRGTMKSRPLPDELRAALSPFLAQPSQ